MLRTTRVMYRPKQAGQKGDGHGKIAHAVSIRERPASVEYRAVSGHRVGDLIEGSSRSYIATMVERQRIPVQREKAVTPVFVQHFRASRACFKASVVFKPSLLHLIRKVSESA